jgi:hypothetical protein
MQYSFDVKTRLILLNILPKEGSITTLRLVRELRESLSFDEDENRALGVTFGPDPSTPGVSRMQWDPNAGVPNKVVEIGETMKGLLKSRLEELDKQSKLTDDFIPVYEMFVEGVPQPTSPPTPSTPIDPPKPNSAAGVGGGPPRVTDVEIAQG